MINAAGINAAGINAPADTGPAPTPIDLALPLTATTETVERQLDIALRARTFARTTLALPLTAVTGGRTLALPLAARTFATAGGLSLPLTARTGDGTLTAGQSRTVAPYATVSGLDVSSRLTGPWEIDREAGRAAIAEFTLKPAAGPIDLATLIGAPVVFGYRIDGGAPDVLFTGTVDEPIYDPTSGLTTYRCTDGLQAHLDAQSNAQIDAAIGGHWSEAVFPPDAVGYEYAQQRLETVAADYDLDRYGRGRTYPWTPAETPHFTFTDDPATGNFLHGSLRLENASHRDQLNRIDLTVEVRYRRRIQRQRTFRWTLGRSFEQHLADSSTLPTEDMVREAATRTGWGITSEHFTRLPPSGWYNGRAWVHDPNTPPFFVLEASLGLARRWAETVTERYHYTVTAPASIAVWGEIAVSDTATISPEPPDADAWLNREFSPAASLSIGPDDLSGFATAPNGDRYRDDLDAAARETAITTALARARTQIIAAHRQHTVEITAPLIPEIDTAHTARVETARLTAHGRIRQLVHRGTADQADQRGPETTVRIAISLASAAAVVDSPITAPPPIAGPPTEPGGGIGFGETATHLGRRASSPPESDAWVGYVGNYAIPIPVSAPAYTERFVIDAGEIDREPVEAERTIPHTVAVPHETLTLAA